MTQTTWGAGQLLACAILACSAAACDGVGRPIVDKVPPDNMYPMACPVKIANCTDAHPPLEPVVARRAPEVLGSCAQPMATCTNPTSPGEALEIQSCELNTTIDANFAPPSFNLGCARLELRAPATVSSLRWSEPAAHKAVIAIHAEQPLTLELVRAEISQTNFELDGPITLRILEQSKLSVVHITGTHPGAQVELSELRADTLTLADFAGSAHVERAQLTDGQLIARQLSIEASNVTQLAIKTERLSAVELKGGGVALETNRGSLAELELSGLRLQACDSVLVVSSLLRESVFWPCRDEPLRVDLSQVSDSTVMGALVGRRSLWDKVTFGPDTDTSLELWNGSVRFSSLCAGVRSASLGGVDPVVCNACEPLAAPEQTLCVTPTDASPEFFPIPGFPPLSQLDVLNPRCPTLDMLPACDPPPYDRTPL